MTPQSERIKNQFSEVMRKSIKNVSMSYCKYLEYINHYLKKIYGNKINWETHIQNYENDLQKYGCSKITCLDDLQELSIDDINHIVEKEQQYSDFINEYINKANYILDEQRSLDDVLKVASMMGVYPGKTENKIFHHMLPNEITVQDILINDIELRTYLEQLINWGRMLSTNGITLEYDDIGAVVTQQRSLGYYRGESAFYGSSKPSLRRKYNSKMTNQNIVLEELKYQECCKFFSSFDVINSWNVSEINYEALAQHYGFPTTLMDITSDVQTALFFMCCKYEDNVWKPLTTSDINKRDARNSISSIGGDSRYGILYIADREIMDMKYLLNSDCRKNTIIPVGYQPFMRCTSQHAYALYTTTSDYDIYHDTRFKKNKVKLNADFCNYIFEKMDQGNKIYPKQDIPNISTFLYKIWNTNTLSEDVVLNNMDLFPYCRNIDDVRPILKKLHISIRKKNDFISPSQLRKINKCYTNEKVTNLLDIDGAKQQPIILI